MPETIFVTINTVIRNGFPFRIAVFIIFLDRREVMYYMFFFSSGNVGDLGTKLYYRTQSNFR
jgi:hypothetical protein